MKKLSKTKRIAVKTIQATFKILMEADGEMRGKDVIDEIRNTVEFDDYEQHRFEKTRNIRWESVLHFYTIEAKKAGFLRKNKGIWSLTEEGIEAFKKYSPSELLSVATKGYKEWDASKKDMLVVKEEQGVYDASQSPKVLLEQYEEQASNGIREFILEKNPYDFQDLVGALLEAMEYYISSIAAPGPDGGIDIIAYTDPLGTSQPRIIVQVKHRPNNTISSNEIQNLSGTLKRSGDVGIFVTSGKFSKPAKKEAVSSREHVELIDFDRFIELWQEYYPKMTDEQKNMLPLYPIYFLGSNE